MENDIRKDRQILKKLFDDITVSDGIGTAISLDEALEKTIKIILAKAKAGGKIIIIGNGGSASIAGHISTDFLKNVKIPAMAFTDSSLLTSLGNDFGYEHVFEKPIKIFTGTGDILFAISSSGKSENILLAVNAAKAKGATVITFSGFNENNPLRRLGEINFYVPSTKYGHVEIVHLSICHFVADMAMEKKNA